MYKSKKYMRAIVKHAKNLWKTLGANSKGFY
jgi:hypothetical protein